MKDSIAFITSLILAGISETTQLASQIEPLNEFDGLMGSVVTFITGLLGVLLNRFLNKRLKKKEGRTK